MSNGKYIFSLQCVLLCFFSDKCAYCFLDSFSLSLKHFRAVNTFFVGMCSMCKSSVLQAFISFQTCYIKCNFITPGGRYFPGYYVGLREGKKVIEVGKRWLVSNF